MKKIIVLLLLLMMIAAPLYALGLLDSIRYKEVQLDSEKVLVNRFTGKVEQRLIDGKYEPISSQKGWGGIPSDQDMYQAQYDRMRK